MKSRVAIPAVVVGLVLSLGGGLAPASADPVQINVGSYNIRNPNSPGDGASWSTRLPHIVAGILAMRLGVVGVQELYQEDGRRQLLSRLNHDSTIGTYAMSAPYDVGGKTSDGYDNRIVYNTARFDLISAGSLRFTYQSSGDSPRWMAWAVLENKANGSSFLFVTTHLCPTDDGADVKQWQQLIYKAKRLGDALHVPVIITGDFNTTKFESPAQYNLAAMRTNGFGDVLGQQYRTYSTYKARAQKRVGAWMSSSNRYDPDIRHWRVSSDRNGNSIDWVFASNALQIPWYRVYARYNYPYLIKPIPSDHNLVAAAIVLP